MKVSPFDDVAMGEGFPLTVATVFQAGDTIINANGTFVYNGTPASGNLIASIAQTSGTDGFGNPYVGGITAYSGANEWASLTGGTVSLQGASGQYQTGQLGTAGSGTTFLSSGLETNTDTGAEVIAQSADAASGSSTITLSAAEVTANGALTVSATLTVNGTDLGSLVATSCPRCPGRPPPPTG